MFYLIGGEQGYQELPASFGDDNRVGAELRVRRLDNPNLLNMCGFEIIKPKVRNHLSESLFLFLYLFPKHSLFSFLISFSSSSFIIF